MRWLLKRCSKVFPLQKLAPPGGAFFLPIFFFLNGAIVYSLCRRHVEEMVASCGKKSCICRRMGIIKRPTLKGDETLEEGCKAPKRAMHKADGDLMESTTDTNRKQADKRNSQLTDDNEDDGGGNAY